MSVCSNLRLLIMALYVQKRWGTMLSLRRCPEDNAELAELYLFDRLSAEDNREAEEHFLSCSRCMDVLEETEAFLNALRAANRTLSAESIFVPAAGPGSNAQWSAVPPSENT
jgi:hypothetical protein